MFNGTWKLTVALMMWYFFMTYTGLQHRKNTPFWIAIKFGIPVLIIYYFTRSVSTTFWFVVVWIVFSLVMNYVNKHFSWRHGFTGISAVDYPLFMGSMISAPIIL